MRLIIEVAMIFKLLCSKSFAPWSASCLLMV
jgi:hypothetical protein